MQSVETLTRKEKAMAISDKFYRVNGMHLTLDFQGLPGKLCDEMKRVTNSPWLSLAQKIKFLDVMRNHYLTDVQEKRRR